MRAEDLEQMRCRCDRRATTVLELGDEHGGVVLGACKRHRWELFALIEDVLGVGLEVVQGSRRKAG